MIRLLALSASILAATIAATPAYHITHRYVLGGTGGWDYLSYDQASKRLYISRSTHVMVVNPWTGEFVGDILNAPSVHGIALAPDLNKGFTSNGRDGTVTVFDLSTLAVVATIKTDAKNPDAIVYEPVTKRVYTFNGGGNDATSIDATSNSVIATIPLGGRPEFAVADGRGAIYNNIEDKDQIVKIDARTNAIVARHDIASCGGPSGLSMDTDHRRLFAACDKHVAVIDADSGAVIANVTSGAGTDATRFSKLFQNAYASNGRDATLTVVHESTPAQFDAAANVATETGARTMEIDPQTGAVFLVTAKMDVNPSATNPRERYRAEPGTFTLLVLEP
ncbi:MAG: YncE family protein [Candidatus Eremiobacteraeota bacterium]|nr:YncE family protein [Candidatus Eremiobacteraeota bacterium]